MDIGRFPPSMVEIVKFSVYIAIRFHFKGTNGHYIAVGCGGVKGIGLVTLNFCFGSTDLGLVAYFSPKSKQDYSPSLKPLVQLREVLVAVLTFASTGDRFFKFSVLKSENRKFLGSVLNSSFEF